MNLATAFADCAEKHAPKIAIFWGETEISYAALSRTGTEQLPPACKPNSA